MTNRGQALIELIIMSSVSLLIVTMGTTVIYRAALQMYAGHYLYESLTCNIHTKNNLCKLDLQKKLVDFPLLQVEKIKFIKIETKKSFKISGLLNIKNPVCVNCKSISFKDSIYVPKTFY